MQTITKKASLLIILFIYLIAITASIYLVRVFSPKTIVFQVLLVDIIATVIVFIFSTILKNASVYDPYWSVIPPLIAAFLIWQNPEGNLTRQIIVFLLILFWSVRLTLNWIRGWKGLKDQDWRYTKLANNTGVYFWFVNLTGIQMLPTLLVFLGCLPLFYILPNPQQFNMLEIVAILITLAATMVEWIADEQLKIFKKGSHQKSYIDTGLWSVTRHPNYLGEICFWLGLYIFVPFSGLEGYATYSVVGFIAMILLFRFISIPLMEKRNFDRKTGYAEYVRKVPMLLPIKIRK